MALANLEAVTISNACYAQRLGWRVRTSGFYYPPGHEGEYRRGQPEAGGVQAYPYAERDPRLAEDVAALQRGLNITPATGVLGAETLRAMVGIVREWISRGSPEEGEIGQTLVRRLILPGIDEIVPQPQPNYPCEEAFAKTAPFGPGTAKAGSGVMVGLVLVVAVFGVALYMTERGR